MLVVISKEQSLFVKHLTDFHTCTFLKMSLHINRQNKTSYSQNKHIQTGRYPNHNLMHQVFTKLKQTDSSH